MPTVAVVRLRHASKDYWFDPNGVDVHEGDHVIVETMRGTEIGLAVMDCVDKDEEEITNPLKPVIRVATQEDLEFADELVQKGKDAIDLCPDGRKT